MDDYKRADTTATPNMDRRCRGSRIRSTYRRIARKRLSQWDARLLQEERCERCGSMLLSDGTCVCAIQNLIPPE